MPAEDAIGVRVGGADAKNPLLAAELADPGAIAAKIAVAGMPQRAGVRMHHAQDGKPAIVLADDPAADRLADRVELDMGDARLALRAGWQGGEGDGFGRFAVAEEHPTGLFFATGAVAMRGKLFKQGTADAVREQHAPQRLQRTRNRLPIRGM